MTRNKYDTLLEAFRIATLNGEPLTLDMMDEVARALKYAADKRREEGHVMLQPDYVRG